MPTSYGAEQTATISLNDLGSFTAAASSSINNSSDLYDALLIILTVNLTGTGTVGVSLYASTDNSLYSEVSLRYAQQNTYTSTGSKTMFFYLKDLPIYYKLFVVNRTSGTFDATGNSLKYRGVKY
jgi:hypothetical protein